MMREDKRIWTLESTRKFTGNLCYNFLHPSVMDEFPLKDLWRCKIPSKVVFFAWIALKGKIFTLDNFQRRGISLPNICFLCHCVEEFVDHILIHCPFALEVWFMFLQEVNLSWVMLNYISSFFLQ